VKDLTPTSRPHSHDIAARAPSTCREDAHAIASPTHELGVLRRHLEQITAVLNRLDYLSKPLATSTETVAAAGARRGACRTEAITTPHMIIRPSRR
jgi:hypothetical protein